MTSACRSVFACPSLLHMLTVTYSVAYWFVTDISTSCISKGYVNVMAYHDTNTCGIWKTTL